MPELPEVETVKKALINNYLGKTILSCEVLLPRMILSPVDEFIKNLKNVQIKSIERKGKYLIFNLSNNYSFISHLRMEGKYVIRDESEANITHTRVVFHLENNKKLCYDDSRSFGIMKMTTTDKIYSLEELTKLGPEPFFINDASYLYQKYQKSRLTIKECLLDQTIMTGLGNIYADEVLFKCKMNPYLEAKSISLDDCSSILKYSIETLNHAIELGGSTISSYHPEKGVDGRFQNELICYGREGLKCVRCSSIMLKDKLGGRGTTYCPKCQHVAKSIGITGKIASGKSSCIAYLKEKGYKVFSCDEDISNLYKQNKVKIELVKLFGEEVINDDGSVSKGFIKNKIVSSPELKKEIEDLIHPIVKQNIKKFIQANKKDELVFIEVPLMFETGFYRIFDEIIGISCSSLTQINHLKARKSSTINKDLLLNASTTFDKNISKCDYLLVNDGSLEEFHFQIDQALKNMLQ